MKQAILNIRLRSTLPRKDLLGDLSSMSVRVRSFVELSDYFEDIHYFKPMDGKNGFIEQ